MANFRTKEMSLPFCRNAGAQIMRYERLAQC